MGEGEVGGFDAALSREPTKSHRLPLQLSAHLSDGNSCLKSVATNH